MTVRRILLGSLVTNCYLLIFSDRVAVVDPGDTPEKILRFCGDLPITDILLTHGHIDHTGALGDLCDRFSPRVYLHENDEEFLNCNPLRCPGTDDYNPAWRTDFACTHRLKDGDKICLGGDGEELVLTVLHTPGHTPGSSCFHWEEGGILFSGDTLFQGTMGRVDFPKGDPAAMARSLNRLATLPAETKVFPGHGFSTTVGEEGWIGGQLF